MHNVWTPTNIVDDHLYSVAAMARAINMCPETLGRRLKLAALKMGVKTLAQENGLYYGRCATAALRVNVRTRAPGNYENRKHKYVRA